MTARYRFGVFDFDAATGRLRRNGRPVALSPKGAAVLAVLLRARNRLVRKEEILAGAWPGVRVEEGSVKVRIAEIRRALGDEASRPRFIETVARRGYRFVAEAAVQDGRIRPRQPAERPRLAVVPFRSDGSPGAARVARGIAEGIAGHLRRWDEIQLESSPPGAHGPRVPGESATVRVEGLVEEGGGTCRVEVRLVEAATGAVIWSGSFAGLPPGDAAARAPAVLELAREIRQSLHPRALRALAPGVPTAREEVLRARAYRWRRTRQANQRAQQHLLRALEIDPAAAEVHAELVGACSVELLCGWAKDLGALLAMSREHATRALELEPRSRAVHVAVAWDCCTHREAEDALVHLERAARIGPPRLPAAFPWLRALALCQLGRLDEAEVLTAELSSRALRHREGDLVFHLHATVQLHRGAFEEAAVAGECASAIRPAWTFDCTAALGWWLSGAPERARQALDRAREHRSDLSRELAGAHMGWMAPPDADCDPYDRLEDAGLPAGGGISPARW